MTDQYARPGKIEVDLKYAGHMNYKPKSFNYAPDATEDPAERLKSNFQSEPHRVSIHDGGSSPSNTDLDREGFVLLHTPTNVTDFRDEAQVKSIYFPETREMLRQLVGAEYVAFPFTDGTYRSTLPEAGDSAPAPFPHVDYTAAGMVAYIDRAFPDRPKNIRRWAVYNIWRLLSSTGPVDMPLAMLDGQTLSAEDQVPVDNHFYNIGTVESMALRYNPAHRWTFYSQMKRDDMLVFKAYDSDPTTNFPAGHSAFRDPTPGTHSRSSFEMRAYVCWYS